MILRRRRSRDPSGGDLTCAVRYHWGLAKFTVTSAEDAPRIWMHAGTIEARAAPRDGDLPAGNDRFVLAIDAPIRLNPGGTVSAHWRPGTIDLEDPRFHRPMLDATFRVSLPHASPIDVRVPVVVHDDFLFEDGAYVLRPDSDLTIPPPRLDS